MKTTVNQYGEKVTKWVNHCHPNNSNYMQLVNWTIWVKPNGHVLVGFNLGSGSKTYFIYNLSEEEAINKYYTNQY